MDKNIRSLGSAEHDQIGSIIARAFADDPVNLWAFCGAAAMQPAFTAMAQYFYLRRGFGHITKDGRAGTLWAPLGPQKSYGLRGTLALASGILRRGGPKALLRGMALDAALTRRRPPRPHFYLFAIGVDPLLQGQGQGSHLMKAGLARADEAHMPAYLESSKLSNVPFYERHGFRVVEEVIPVKGCPPMWLMWRGVR